MEVRSIYKYARISPLKARDVARQIQGMPVSQALDILNYTPRKAAFLVGKTLKSAIANAENNHELDVEKLTVREAVVGDGPIFRRFKPRARGSAGPIRKRTCHITVMLTDEDEVEDPKAKSGTKKKAKKAAPKKAAPKAKAPVVKDTPVEVEDVVESTTTEAVQSTSEVLPASDVPDITEDAASIAATELAEKYAASDTSSSSVTETSEGSSVKPLGKPDNLKIVEGIGPKVELALKAAGVIDLKALSEQSVEQIQKILDEGDGNFGGQDPTTWAEQSGMAARGEWEKLKKWQDELDGGKLPV